MFVLGGLDMIEFVKYIFWCIDCLRWNVDKKMVGVFSKERFGNVIEVFRVIVGWYELIIWVWLDGFLR